MFVLEVLSEHQLLDGTTVGVDATLLEANAAMKSIVRQDGGEDWEAYIQRLAAEDGVELQTKADLIRYDKYQTHLDAASGLLSDLRKVVADKAQSSGRHAGPVRRAGVLRCEDVHSQAARDGEPSGTGHSGPRPARSGHQQPPSYTAEIRPAVAAPAERGGGAELRPCL